MLNNIERLLAEKGFDKGLLLQHLYSIQLEYSYIPAVAIDFLIKKLEVTRAEVLAVIDFYSFLHIEPRGHYDILFSDSITDHMLGSRILLEQLCFSLGVKPGIPDKAGRVTVDMTSCTGMCDQGPAMLVNGYAVTRLDANRIEDIVALIAKDMPVEQWPDDYFRVDDNIQQTGLLLESTTNPGDALSRLQKENPDKLLQVIADSGLRGRGGAGFPTADKWRYCRGAEATQRFVVCNADEGEPGTFKDRVILQSYIDEVIEGMTLCARIVGAQQGFIYLRGEYLYLRKHIQSAIDRRRENQLLGKRILAVEDFDFDIDIHMGAGAYICGEESALIESLEGKRGIPRNRPPFPVTQGYLDQPTVVNNPETFLAAVNIIIHGANKYKQDGTPESTGTKLLSISGDCKKPGIYEVPFGRTIREVLRDCGAENTLAVQVAGAAGYCFSKADFHRNISFEDISTGGSFIVFNKSRELLDMVQNFSRFFVHESCGFCTPCRVGGSLLNDLVEKVCNSHATEYDLQEIRNICHVMQNTSHCGLGNTAPNHVLSTLEKFYDIYQQRLCSTDYEPAFDLDAALSESRALTGRKETIV